jgi:AraC-like DNA-binding protein
MTALAISMMALGIAGFALQLLLTQTRQNPYVVPVVAAMGALALIATGPLVFELSPWLIDLYIAAILPAFLVLSPSLWLYTVALTSQSSWKFQRAYLYHFGLGAFGLLVGLFMLGLPDQTRASIFFSDREVPAGYPTLVVILLFFAFLLWLVQSAIYVVAIVRRTFAYHRQLKQVFSETRAKSLGWLNALVGLIVVAWLWSLLALLHLPFLPDGMFNDTGGFFLTLVVVWALAYYGLKQQPGFQSIEDQSCINQILEDNDNRYQRSALGEEQAQRIAGKLQELLVSEKLYLDADLTLTKLANHLGVSANYLSQTLNQTLGMSFFEYVNRARIEAAKDKLLQKDESILNIAMAVGFNARSSFYKSFKASTGMTPSQFQKAHSSV